MFITLLDACPTDPLRLLHNLPMTFSRFFSMVFILAALAACAGPRAASVTPTPPGTCVLSPVVAPTRPVVTPGYTELDPATGLHYTGKAQDIDLSAYRLVVKGKVKTPLSLSYDDLRCLPKKSVDDALICPGYFEDYAIWSGASLADVLDLAGVLPEATRLELHGADGYLASLSLKEALAQDSLLAYEWEGEPLPVLHGFPVRAVFPAMKGNKWVKWLIEIVIF